MCIISLCGTTLHSRSNLTNQALLAQILRICKGLLFGPPSKCFTYLLTYFKRTYRRLHEMSDWPPAIRAWHSSSGHVTSVTWPWLVTSLSTGRRSVVMSGAWRGPPRWVVDVSDVYSAWPSRPGPRTRSAWRPRTTARKEVLRADQRPTGARPPPTYLITTRPVSAGSTPDLQRFTLSGRYLDSIACNLLNVYTTLVNVYTHYGGQLQNVDGSYSTTKFNVDNRYRQSSSAKSSAYIYLILFRIVILLLHDACATLVFDIAYRTLC